MKLPEIGYLRLYQIIGDQHSKPPIAGIIPMSKAAWYKGIQDGRYPKPVKLSARMVGWKVQDIRNLVSELNKNVVEVLDDYEVMANRYGGSSK